MKVLLDENIPHKLRLALIPHDVRTASYMGWEGVTNGNLLSIAERHGFEVMITGDKNLEYQQNMNGRTISIIVLSVSKWAIVKTKLPEIQHAIANAKSGSFEFVDCTDPGA